jgi:hypothetical protein
MTRLERPVRRIARRTYAVLYSRAPRAIVVSLEPGDVISFREVGRRQSWSGSYRPNVSTGRPRDGAGSAEPTPDPPLNGRRSLPQRLFDRYLKRRHLHSLRRCLGQVEGRAHHLFDHFITGVARVLGYFSHGRFDSCGK